MDKKLRLIILGAVAALGIVVLTWAWWPAPAPKVDPDILRAAADGAREAEAKHPPPPDDPAAPRGRARPGSLGGPTP